MPDSSDQPTQKSDPPRDPRADETRDAPLPNGPHTLSFGGAPPGDGAHEPVVLPGYAIVRELGSGGMGVVYEARQVKLNRPVALKVLRGRSGAQDVLRFLAEAEAVAAIKHPHVVQVYEFGQHAGGPYMALELLTGGTLSERLQRDGRLAPRDAAALVAKLADAVQAAHDLGIIHRDLKPSNVLFASRSEPRPAVPDAAVSAPVLLSESGFRTSDLSPKLTDFGLAKKTGADLTRTQAVMGTPAYMAPEQARGDAKFVGPAADVWALGAILYECLTGKRAFDADDTWAILRKVTEAAPLAPRAHVAGLPRDLELIVLKCLEKNPADRYPTAAALAADLESFLAGRSVSVRPAGRGERLVKWVKRNPVIAGATVAVALALVIGSAVSLAFALEAEKKGREVSKANETLNLALDDLKKSNAALADQTGRLTKSRNSLAEAIKVAEGAQAYAEARGYLSDIALAHQMWKANDLRGARTALDRCPEDRRKWEWHHLDAACRPDKAEYAADSLPTALAYSPDGKFLAWGTLSGTIVVRDLTTGAEKFKITPPEPLSAPVQLAFRPSGGELASAVNTRVYTLDLASGQSTEIVPKDKPKGERLSFQYVAVGYTPDGRVLAALETRGEKPEEMTITVRDPAAGKGVVVVRGPTGQPGLHVRISGAAFNRDCTRLAAAFVDSGVRTSAAGKEPVKFEPFRPVVIAWEVPSARPEGVLASGKELARTEGSAGMLGSLEFDDASRTVAYGRAGQTGELRTSGEAPRMFPGHVGEVTAVAFDRNGLLWSGGEDRRIVAFDRSNGAERFVFRGCRHGVLRLAVSPDGKEVAAATGDLLGSAGAVHRFDVASAAADVWQASTARDRVSLVTALAPDGGRFAACDFDLGGEGPERARVVLGEVGGKPVEVKPPGGILFRGAFFPDGRLFVLEKDRTFRLISPEGKPGALMSLPKEVTVRNPPAVFGGPGGRVAVTVSTSLPNKTGPQQDTRAVVMTWDADRSELRPFATADLHTVLPPGIDNASLFPTGGGFDRDGKRLTASFALGWTEKNRARIELRGVVLVWNVASGKEVFRRVTDEALHAAGFDPQGRVVAAGGTSSGGVVYAWDTASGKEEMVLRGHTRPVLAFAFGPDGRLATGGADRVVKLWEIPSARPEGVVASKREVLAFDGFAREVMHVAFTADGKNLVAATGFDMLNGMMMGGGMPSDWPPAEVRVFRGPR